MKNFMTLALLAVTMTASMSSCGDSDILNSGAAKKALKKKPFLQRIIARSRSAQGSTKWTATISTNSHACKLPE